MGSAFVLKCFYHSCHMYKDMRWLRSCGKSAQSCRLSLSIPSAHQKYFPLHGLRVVSHAQIAIPRQRGLKTTECRWKGLSRWRLVMPFCHAVAASSPRSCNNMRLEGHPEAEGFDTVSAGSHRSPTVPPITPNL